MLQQANTESKVKNAESTKELRYVALPQRQCKRAYAIDEYYNKEALSSAPHVDKSKYNKVSYPEYRFYDQRHVAILEMEHDLATQKQLGQNRAKDTTDVDFSKSAESVHDDVCAAPANFDLPPDVLAEKLRYEAESFIDWSNNDFRSFVDALERNGRSCPAATVQEVAIELDKPLSEVQRYYDTFLRRYRELSDFQKIIENVDHADTRVAKENEVKKTIDLKIERHIGSFHAFALSYGSAKGKLFSDEEDAFLVLMLHKYGYGSWEKIRLEIKTCWLFRYDWFFKSRSCAELQKRCEVLLRLIERENEDLLERREDGFVE